MNLLSLFTGIGLHDLGLERAGFRIAAQVEIDPYCRAVLERHWPEVTRFDDVRTVSADALRLAGVGRIDLITGGFPCQDISVAGKGEGLDGKRSGLWHEMRRIVSNVRPDWVLAENVPALRTRGADRVLADLEAIGYACWPLVVGALHAGAPHRRLRVWIVAHRDGDGLEFERRSELLDGERTARRNDADGRGEWRLGNADRAGLAILRGERGDDGAERQAAERAGRGDVPDAQGERREGQGDGWISGSWARRNGPRWPARPGQEQHDWEAPRLTQSRVGGAAHGYARRVDVLVRRDRLRALGNANPPQIPEAIGRAIIAAQRWVVGSGDHGHTSR